ncbi:MAG: LysR family transcriptional regulator [Ramlibacter sp.]|nr:LysR family transcriptional regulator [Ramlibacter sp.]
MQTHSAEMGLFHMVVTHGSLSSAARELNLSVPAVSKRLAQLEARLGVRLLNRTTRKMSLTGEGEMYLRMADRILADIATLEESMTAARTVPTGLLRVNSALGFGRVHMAQAITDYMRLHPGVRVQLELTDLPLNLVSTGYDVGIRVGNLPDTTLVARRIFDNELYVCASPDYLKRRGTPRKIDDLLQHDCIVLRENREDHATWTLAERTGSKSASRSVKVRGPLSVNDGHIALQWALDGYGIILRSAYDVAPLIVAGNLKRLLPHYRSGDFDVYAVYAQRQNVPAKIRSFIDFLVARFAPYRGRA